MIIRLVVYPDHSLRSIHSGCRFTILQKPRKGTAWVSGGARQNDLHVYSALRCVGQGFDRLLVRHEIGVREGNGVARMREGGNIA